MRKKAHFLRSAGPTWLIALGMAITVPLLFGDAAEALLRYEREALAAGQWWRWLTGHLVHLNPAHWALNMAGLVLSALLVGAGLAGMRGVVILVGAALGCSLGLWLFSPQIAWYVGLSGALHGLLLGGALALPAEQRRWGAAIGVLVLAKLLGEQWWGASLGTERLIGHAVIVDAHLYGAVGGCLGWLVHRLGGALGRCVNPPVS